MADLTGMTLEPVHLTRGGHRMTDLADALRAEPPPAVKPLPGMMRPDKLIAKPKRFTMERLQRVALWGAAAAATLLVVVLTSQSQVAENRIALILHRPQPAAAAPFDAQAETLRLAEALRRLSNSDEQIQSRLAAVEQDMQDVTGSINKQIKAAAENRRADDGPSVVATAAVSAAVPALADIASASPPATVQTAAESPAPAPSPMQFGVDIGSGLTIAALRMRWAAIRTAHPQFFEGMEPILSVKEIPHSNRIELRLIAGPIEQPGTAARLCGQLSLAGLYCQPTIFDGQHLALH
jgi:hypothetical protein